MNQRLYVLSDYKMLSRRFNGSKVSCIDLRGITKEGRRYVITTPHREVMHRLKHRNDDYFVTPITLDLLKEYCQHNKMDVMTVHECYDTQDKEVCDISLDSF